jgi:hypothetical protein
VGTCSRAKLSVRHFPTPSPSPEGEGSLTTKDAPARIVTSCTSASFVLLEKPLYTTVNDQRSYTYPTPDEPPGAADEWPSLQ